MINSLPISVLSFLGQLGAIWNVLGMKNFPVRSLGQNALVFQVLIGTDKFIGVFVLMILIPSVATERASTKFVFTHFNADNGDGINSRPYMFLLGLLMSQYTLTGYDASAHMVNIFYTIVNPGCNRK